MDFKGVHLDSYNYCSDNDKDNYYRNHQYTENEKEKTKELKDRMAEFARKVYGEEAVESFCSLNCYEGDISYFEDIGYIVISNPDRDEVYIYYYGKDLEEAFINIVVDCVTYRSSRRETLYRSELAKEYKERFPNSKYANDKYHGAFFTADLSLKDFRKYFGDSMPKEIVEFYEKYIQEIEDPDLEYDYETNGLVKKLK